MLNKSPLFFILVLLILNPYTVIGPFGYYVAAPIFFYSLRYLTIINLKILFLFIFCIFISILGVLSSVVHGIDQLEHFKVSVLIFVYFIIGFGLCLGLSNKIRFIDFLVLSMYVVVLNGVVVLLQVIFPEFRSIVESAFVEGGNIDWTEGFRFRGLASAGGASLSVLSAVMVYLSLHLYSNNRINIIKLYFILLILITSVLFIGRTGVLLISVALLMYVVSNGFLNLRILIYFIAGVLLFIFIGVDLIEDFISYYFGDGYFKYSLGFILEGKDGIEGEGTTQVVYEYLKVLPSGFPEVVTGYGFYGGSSFTPWTDSGYARMFLSVGYLFGFLFYVSIFYIFWFSSVSKKDLLFPILILLAISEVKEPLLLSGFSARLFFILLGFSAAEKIKSKTVV
ncbi:hypothetical protein MCEMAEM4_00087 [Burkholderiaceae bacterium]